MTERGTSIAAPAVANAGVVIRGHGPCRHSLPGAGELPLTPAPPVAAGVVDAPGSRQLLEALGRPDVSGSAGYAELGFSAMAANVQARVERSPRWAEGARCMARRLEKLPQARYALAGGVVSFSMAE